MSLLGDIATFVIDPTGTLYATKKAGEEIYEELSDQSDGKPGGKPPGGLMDTPSGKTKPTNIFDSEMQCCSQYQIQEGFLINTKTGAVWKYDKTNNEFNVVKRNDPEIAKAALEALYNDLADYMLTEKTKKVATMHHSVAKEFEKKIDNIVKILKRK